MTTTSTSCPCCGDDMHYDLVTCWTCYRLSHRLTPGTHDDGNGGSFELTVQTIQSYDTQRSARVFGGAL